MLPTSQATHLPSPLLPTTLTPLVTSATSAKVVDTDEENPVATFPRYPVATSSQKSAPPFLPNRKVCRGRTPFKPTRMDATVSQKATGMILGDANVKQSKREQFIVEESKQRLIH